ncbi:hypothetical protein PYV00_00270 [Novosphingobium sp. H3SJ31-1]|uniref:Tetratricopeptide repeat protein n=2 Tax=Novosphingobium album (ex Liu et al. 2023) TaxID=3031130 RepID=A0ABT5WJC3_9SPHN|nr:hypothetical protein [Novosphingobium album (ex Liu et al. 2023)]
MSATALIASALIAQSAFSMAMDTPVEQKNDIATVELQAGQPTEAIRKLEVAASDDPATLINLGTAYARTGMTDKAIAAYRAAVATDVRYDLQLADGTWMDSRRAARNALQDLLRANTIAAR